jgi:hypothetical protein
MIFKGEIGRGNTVACFASTTGRAKKYPSQDIRSPDRDFNPADKKYKAKFLLGEYLLNRKLTLIFVQYGRS